MLYSVSDLEIFDIVPGYHARMIHSENMTLAYVDVDEGADLPEHAHFHEQVLNLLEGHFELVLGGQHMLIQTGEVVVIPANVRHSGKALTRCRILDVFYPIREDFRSKQVAYANV